MTDDPAFISPSLVHSLREIKQSIWFRIGTLHEDMNDNEAALTAFEKVLVHSPSNSAARAKVGILLMKKECYRDAISHLYSAVTVNPENPPAWVALAYSYVMSDELDNAYQAYHTAMSKMSHYNDPTLWFGVGIMYDRMGLLDHALDAFHAVLNLSPHFDAADKLCYDIGVIYKEQHKYELAHKYMTRVVSTKHHQPVAYAEALYQIGHIHELAGNTPSAMEAYHGALTRNPNHVKCLQSLGWLTYKSENVEEATRLLVHATQVEPSDAFTYYMIGRMAMATKDYHKAYDNYQHAVFQDGKNANFWCAIGILYFHMRQHRDAMDAYSRAIRINPQMPEVWYDMGTLYEVYNQTNDAMDAYGKVLQLQPNDQQAAQRLATLQHAVTNGVMPPTPSALPRTEGPVVSPNPASAVRAHTRSDAPERIGALPPPPRITPRTNIASSAPVSYPAPIPASNHRDEAQIQTGVKLLVSTPSMPMTSGQLGQLDPKVAQLNPNPNGAATNGIVVDSTTYPPSSQGKPYTNGGPGIVVVNGPTGYSNLNERRNTVTGMPSVSAPEASSQLSSLSKPHPVGNFNPGGAPQDSGSSRPMDRMLSQEKMPPNATSSGQGMHASQPQNTFGLQGSQINSSPPRSLGVPVQSISGGVSTPAFRTGERRDMWNHNSRYNGYEDNRIVRSDSNRSYPTPTTGHLDQSHYGARAPSQSNATSLNGAPRPVYHNEQNDAGRSQPFPSQADKSPGHRSLQPQQRQVGPVPPLANSMPSEDRSRLSASSSYERRATPAEGLRPNTSKDVIRTGGNGSVPSAENENRYGSPGSRNSRRSLPAPLPGPPTAFNGRPQGLGVSNMNRGDDHLDEAMLPRLRPLPDPKPTSPAAEVDKKGTSPVDREGPLASVRRIDSGMQPSVHRNWSDPSDQNSRRGSLHGTPQQGNGNSPRSQRSPHDNRISREQTGLSRPSEGTATREHGYGSIQTSTEGQQASGVQQSGDSLAAANVGLSNEPSRFHEERAGNQMKPYSSQASMSSRDATLDRPSGGDALKVPEQTPQQPSAMKLESYGGSRPFAPANSNSAPRVEPERGHFQQPVSDSDRGKIVPPNGYHGGAAPSSVREGADPSGSNHDMRSGTKVTATDGHFGSGSPASFSKSLPRAPATNGLMSTPITGKENDNIAGQNRPYYDRTQGSYGSAEKRPAESPNGYNRSPRGSKRKMSDLVDGRAEDSDSKQYTRDQGETAVPEGKVVGSGLTRPDSTLFSRMTRKLPEPIGTSRGDGEDMGHSHKRVRPHGMAEDGLATRMNGSQLKSRE